MNLMNFTFWTVSLNFFRNVHVLHYQLCIKETYAFLYFMTFKAKTNSFQHAGFVFFYSSYCQNPPIYNNNQQNAVLIVLLLAESILGCFLVVQVATSSLFFRYCCGDSTCRQCTVIYSIGKDFCVF